MQSLLKAIASCEFDQSLLSPYLFSPLFFKTKKGENDVVFICFRLMVVF